METDENSITRHLGPVHSLEQPFPTGRYLGLLPRRRVATNEKEPPKGSKARAEECRNLARSPPSPLEPDFLWFKYRRKMFILPVPFIYPRSGAARSPLQMKRITLIFDAKHHRQAPWPRQTLFFPFPSPSFFRVRPWTGGPDVPTSGERDLLALGGPWETEAATSTRTGSQSSRIPPNRNKSCLGSIPNPV